MNFKRISTAALSLAMALSMAAPAFAAGEDASALLISPNPDAVAETYGGVVSVNGEEIPSVTYTYPIEGSWEEREEIFSIGDLPGAPAGYVPMRLLCQATEGGAAYWFPEENQSMFYINETQIYTNFADNSVYVLNADREQVLQEGVTCYLRGGVTFLPADFLNTLDGITVEVSEVDGQARFDVTLEVPGTPLRKLSVSIQKALEIGDGMAPDEYLTAIEEDISGFEELVGQVPMINIRSDAVVIGKYAEGADKEAAKAALKKIQDIQIQNFEHYLPGPLEVAKNGRIVESEDGKYVMLIMSEDNDTAIALFQEGILLVEAEANGPQGR